MRPKLTLASSLGRYIAWQDGFFDLYWTCSFENKMIWKSERFKNKMLNYGHYHITLNILNYFLDLIDFKLNLSTIRSSIFSTRTRKPFSTRLITHRASFIKFTNNFSNWFLSLHFGDWIAVFIFIFFKIKCIFSWKWYF